MSCSLGFGVLIEVKRVDPCWNDNLKNCAMYTDKFPDQSYTGRQMSSDTDQERLWQTHSTTSETPWGFYIEDSLSGNEVSRVSNPHFGTIMNQLMNSLPAKGPGTLTERGLKSSSKGAVGLLRGVIRPHIQKSNDSPEFSQRSLSIVNALRHGCWRDCFKSKFGEAGRPWGWDLEQCQLNRQLLSQSQTFLCLWQLSHPSASSLENGLLKPVAASGDSTERFKAPPPGGRPADDHPREGSGKGCFQRDVRSTDVLSP
eukprot:331720-Amphidinium_carterae.2